jgi:hypothetical protein
LAHTNGVGVLAYHPPRESIPQPASRAADDFHIVCTEADFLSKLPVKRILGGFIMFDATLGKLPGVLPYSPCPENFSSVIGQNDSDVGSETV